LFGDTCSRDGGDLFRLPGYRYIDCPGGDGGSDGVVSTDASADHAIVACVSAAIEPDLLNFRRVNHYAMFMTVLTRLGTTSPAQIDKQAATTCFTVTGVTCGIVTVYSYADRG